MLIIDELVCNGSRNCAAYLSTINFKSFKDSSMMTMTSPMLMHCGIASWESGILLCHCNSFRYVSCCFSICAKHALDVKLERTIRRSQVHGGGCDLKVAVEVCYYLDSYHGRSLSITLTSTLEYSWKWYRPLHKMRRRYSFIFILSCNWYKLSKKYVCPVFLGKVQCLRMPPSP